jgi:hypothetical protein
MTMDNWPTPPPGGQPAGGVNQFGFPTTGAPAPTAARSAATPVRGGGGSSSTNLGTVLAIGVVVLALLVGGFLVFRGLGKTAAAGAQVGQNTIKSANDTDSKQALVNAAQAMETWYSDHENYAITGHVTGLSATAHVQVASTDQGYCLRAYDATGRAQGPVNGSYWWYDSQAGGLLAEPGPAAATAGIGGICSSASAFTALS